MQKRKQSKYRTINCQMCGKKFETNHSQGKYCSNCRQQSLRNGWNKYSAKNRIKRREHCKEYYRKNRKKVASRIKKYRATEAGKQVVRISDRRRREKYPEKYQARQEVLKALRKGILVKKPCEVCGNKKVEAHHGDYGKPLKVRWLCNKHHRVLENRLINY